MSTPACRTACLALILLLSGCGWKVGAMPTPHLSAGPVGGATVAPGLHTALQAGMTRHLAKRGIDPGPPITLEVRSSSLSPHSGVADVGTVAFRAQLEVIAYVEGRPGCVAEIEVSRLWVAPGVAADSSAARDAAVSWLADEVSVRVVDVLAGKQECQ